MATALYAAFIAVVAASPPRRLVINGSTVSAPESPGVPLKLRGFNFWPALDQPISSLDTVVTDLLPKTNFARLVMVHWKDAKGVDNRGSDCYAPHAPNMGFLKQECVAQFDDAIGWTTRNRIWTVITGRSKAGDDHSPIWDNATLASEYLAMLRFLANRYANVSNVAGYEPLAEPRLTNESQIRDFYLHACNAVWAFDARAACFVGAGKFYDRYKIDASFIIPNKPVIYAANYLTPKTFTESGESALPVDFKYPGSKIKCGDLVAQKEIAHVCPQGDRDAEITFNKDFLRLLAQPLFDIKSKLNVPVWVDQWGIVGGVRGGNASMMAYMEDALALWEEEGDFPWTQWIWRSYYTPNCTGYGVVCSVNVNPADVCSTVWYPQVNLLKPLSKYLGGDGGGDGAPLAHQPPQSPVCICIHEAKQLCATTSSAGDTCKSCVWKHKSDLTKDGCDWDKDHSAIVTGACVGNSKPEESEGSVYV